MHKTEFGGQRYPGLNPTFIRGFAPTPLLRYQAVVVRRKVNKLR